MRPSGARNVKREAGEIKQIITHLSPEHYSLKLCVVTRDGVSSLLDRMSDSSAARRWHSLLKFAIDELCVIGLSFNEISRQRITRRHYPRRSALLAANDDMLAEAGGIIARASFHEAIQLGYDVAKVGAAASPACCCRDGDMRLVLLWR